VKVKGNGLMNLLQLLQKRITKCVDFLGGRDEFSFKFSDHQYSKKLACEVVTLSMRFKRSGMTLPLSELGGRPDLIRQIHPFEAYLIGMLIAREKMRSYQKFIRMPIEKLNTVPLTREMCDLFYISSLYEDASQETILTMKMKGMDHHEMKMSLKKLRQTIGMIEFVSSEQACLIGQIMGEEIIQNIGNSPLGADYEIA
jgi:hypothetical protein